MSETYTLEEAKEIIHSSVDYERIQHYANLRNAVASYFIASWRYMRGAYNDDEMDKATFNLLNSFLGTPDPEETDKNPLVQAVASLLETTEENIQLQERARIGTLVCEAMASAEMARMPLGAWYSTYVEGDEDRDRG